MAFTLPPLPYDKNALAPHISAETLEYHHGKHHQAYVTNLNKLIEGKPEASKSLEDIILSSEGGVFNNAAQVWNHTFYWQLHEAERRRAADGRAGRRHQARLRQLREVQSRSSRTRRRRSSAAAGRGSSSARTRSSPSPRRGNADLPMKHGQKALLTIDVWEHAYYIDFRNARPKYIETFLKSLVNWDCGARAAEEGA